MAVCATGHLSLPRLPLDKLVPNNVMNRRGAISFPSSDSRRTGPRFERRGGVSFERSDRNALYVRMLGDMKIRTKPELVRERRRNSLLDPDFKILENLELSHHRPCCGLKFHSLHRARRRRRPVKFLSNDNASILDAHYSGQAKCLLSTVGDWRFNIFNLDKLTNGRALFHICLHLFQEHGLIEIFKLDIVKLMRCFTLIEEGYHSNNPYHNSVHAADVTQAMHCYLRENRLARCVSPLETMVALLAASTHDLDHPGVNQAFLIATSSPLATLYKNSSVLENHHWRSAVAIIHESGVFDHLDPQLRAMIEWQLKSLILATDITRQQEFLCRFKRHLDGRTLDLVDDEQRHFMLQIALKCADICNPCRPWEISKKWSEKVCDEFFQQGDYERQLHLPVTPNCDRYKTTVAKIQSGFMQFVVLPLFHEWHRFNPTHLTKFMLQNIRSNKANWDVILHESEEQQKTEELSSSEEDENHDPNSNLKGGHNHHDRANGKDIDSEKVFEMCPVSEEMGIPKCQQRRHSLPPPAIATKDATLLLPRRGSLPKMCLYDSARQRHSLLQSTLSQSTSLDKLAEKLTAFSKPNSHRKTERHYPFETVVEIRPKMTNLSMDVDTMKMFSSRERYLAQKNPALEMGVAQRPSGGRASLPLLRIPQVSHSSIKEGYMPNESELNTNTFHVKVLGNNNHPVSVCQRTNTNGSRQILRQLNTNSHLPHREIRLTRGRSGSEEAARISAHARTLRGILFDRPRSLSLEIESQPLLLGRLDHKSSSGDGNRAELMSDQLEAAASLSFGSTKEAMVASPLLEEDVTLTTPLLHDQRVIPADVQSQATYNQ